MKTIACTEFRKRASALLDWVEKGGTVRVMRHGQPVAKIIPAESARRPPAWKTAPPRLVVSGGSLSRAVLEEKGSRP
jgi:prevent-host-death family protein